VGFNLDQAKQLLATAVPEVINTAAPDSNRLGWMAKLADEIGCHPNTIKNLAYGETQASGALLICLLRRFPELKADLLGMEAATPRRTDIARQLRAMADTIQSCAPEKVVPIDMQGKIK